MIDFIVCQYLIWYYHELSMNVIGSYWFPQLPMNTFVVKIGCFSQRFPTSFFRREDHVEVLRPHSSRPALGQFPGLWSAPARQGPDLGTGFGDRGDRITVGWDQGMGSRDEMMWIYGYVKTIHMIYIWCIYIYIIYMCVCVRSLEGI